MSITTKRGWLLAGLLAWASMPVVPARADMKDDAIFTYFEVMAERRFVRGSDGFEWAAHGWIGEDYNKLRLRSLGAIDDRGRVENEGGYKGVEFQVLYSRLVHEFWDAKVGLRFSHFAHGRERFFLTAGFEGTAPYGFKVDAMAFLSDRAAASARLDIEYDVLVTQRWVLAPFIDLDGSAGDDKRIGQKNISGKVEAGLRVRYEIVREVAPYVGISYTRLLGGAASLARDDGEPVGAVSLIAGIRVWF